MNSLDIGILSIASIFFIRGILRGFIYELITVVGLILGYIISITYLSLLSAFILSFFPSLPEPVIKLISFFVLFVGTNLILRLVAKILTKTVKIAMLGWLNRLLGGLIGVLKGIIIMGIIVFVLNMLPFSSVLLDNPEINESQIYPLLEVLGPQLYAQIQKYTHLLF
jgi:membrane protein required for colicin V production